MTNYILKSLGIPNQQGLRLAAIHYTRPGRPGPTLVICHGFTGSKEGSGRVLEMAEYLAGCLKLDCLAFDFAGHGKSQGKIEDMSLSGQIQDLQSVVDWCLETKKTPVLTLGRSFGGCTVICQAALDPAVQAVCSWAAPADPYSLLQGFVLEYAETGLITLGSQEGQIQLKEDFFPDLAGFDIPDSAARISPRPVLLIHGQEDEVVPVHEARRIYEQAREPKELHIIPGADHRFAHTYQQVWHKCAAWLQTLELNQ